VFVGFFFFFWGELSHQDCSTLLPSDNLKDRQNGGDHGFCEVHGDGGRRARWVTILVVLGAVLDILRRDFRVLVADFPPGVSKVIFMPSSGVFLFPRRFSGAGLCESVFFFTFLLTLSDGSGLLIFYSSRVGRFRCN